MDLRTCSGKTEIIHINLIYVLISIALKCLFLSCLSIFLLSTYVLLFPSGNFDFLKPYVVTMLILCALTFIVLLFGIYAVNICSIPMMAMVAGLLLILLLIGLISHLIIYVSPKEEPTEDTNINQLLDKYKSSSDIKKFWEKKQNSEQCCGAYGPQDWIKRNITMPNGCCHIYDKEFTDDPISSYCNFAMQGKFYLYQNGCFDNKLDIGEASFPIIMLIGFTYLVQGISTTILIYLACRNWQSC